MTKNYTEMAKTNKQSIDLLLLTHNHAYSSTLETTHRQHEQINLDTRNYNVSTDL